MGTTAIVVATAWSAVTVYVFEVIAGRTLGADDFAPIGVIWTVGFLGFTVLLIPVEQLITRQLVLAQGDHRHLGSSLRPVGLVIVAVIAGTVGFVALTVERFFAGATAFVAVALGLAVARSIVAVVRGFLAGRRRFHAYAAAIALEATALVALGGLAAILRPTAVGFGVAMALAPLATLATMPFRRRPPAQEVGTVIQVGAATFLGWFVLANAGSQFILAGGPIVVGLLGGSAAAISIYFITFTLFRGPMTSSYNLLARVLPDFTEMARSGANDRLDRWAILLGVGGAVLAVVFAVSAAILGPWVIEVLYGAEFAPTRLVAALGAAGVGAGLAGLFTAQIFVARGATRWLALAWGAALVAAGLAVWLIAGEPIVRVAAGFVVGEVTALAALTAFAVAGTSR